MKLERLEQRQLLSTALDGGILRILTSAGADTIAIANDGGNLTVRENGTSSSFALASVSKIHIETGAGNDLVLAPDIAIPIEAYLGAGNDSLFSGSGNDTIYGSGGADLINAGDGNNAVYGESGDDRIVTGAGNDTVNGGGGSDAINTGAGTNQVIGTTKNVNSGKGMVYSPLTRGVTYQSDAFISNVAGYDPNQIRKAYGFGELDALQTVDFARLPQIALDFKRHREVSAADLAMLQTAWNYGYGQTIYIVDAFTGLDVQQDFTTFCQQFNLPLPTDINFSIINSAGKRTPAVNSDWAGEIMLDLEWSHAIAPAARIVLVQADSDISVDLYRATKKAADMAQKSGGGIISMSFGRDLVYDPGVTGYDPTTTGDMILWDNMFRSHGKVTFLAASGDAGSASVASWPAMSPYVTAVGGTTLAIDQDGNRIGEEAAWFDGGSGYALPDWYERPSYQNGITYYLPQDPYTPAMTPIAADENVRGIPDVSMNADPATPYAIFTSTPIEGNRGWFSVGGTSAATPEWAAIVALANAKRQAAGLGVIGNRFNGALYDIYNGYAGGAGSNQEYEDCFNDVTFGQAGPWFAAPRYDMATGIGTPRAENLINTLGDYTGFMVQNTFTFDARLYMPFSLAQFGKLPVASGQRHTGTGTIVGTDHVDLLFSTDPVRFVGPNFTSAIVADRYYDVEPEPLPSDFRVRLNRTGRGQSRGQIYGIGTADIYNGDSNIVTTTGGTNGGTGAGTQAFFPATFTLKFSGTWWTGKDGKVHFHIEFGAVDPVTYQPLESRPGALVYNPGVPWLGAYYAGEING